MEKNIIEEAKAYINNLFNNNADGHDAEHSIRVYQNALTIAESYPDSDITIISLASLLHDVDDHKLFNTENNMNARNFLQSQNLESDMIERICDVINGVSFTKNRGKRPETLEGKIVQDADRLDAMGAIGIARTFAYGGKCGRNTQEAKKIAEIRHEYMQGFLNEIQEEINTK